MKKIISIFLFLTFIGFMGCQSNDNSEFNTDKIEKPDELWEQFSYIVGNSMGARFKKDSIYNLDFTYFRAGVQMELEDKNSLLSRQEMDSVMKIVEDILQERNKNKNRQAELKAQKNLEESQKFLAENKKKESIIVTQSGLQYEILKEGSGSSPLPKDHCKVHVVANVHNGKEFDNTYKEGKPKYVFLNEKIIFPAWYEALRKMKVGSKLRLFAPPDLVFSGNIPPDLGIEPNKLIIFELELVEFQPEPYPDEPAPPSDISVPGNQGMPMPPPPPSQQ